MKKKIVILGGSGYLGTTLCASLLAQSHEVLCIDCCWFGEEALNSFSNDRNFTLIKHDLRKLDDLETFLKNAYAVINLAGIVGDPACELDNAYAKTCNYQVAQKSAVISKRLGISRYLFASSCSVYGKTEHNRLTESSNTLPLSYYAQDKLDSEIAIKALASDDFHPTILRLSTLFGWSSRMRFDLVINLLTARASLAKPLRVFGGKQWRPFLHIKDASQAFEKILFSDLPIVSNQIFNVGSDQNNFRIIDVANLIARKIPTTLELLKTETDQRDYRVDFSKIHQLLNFNSTITIENAIEEIRANILTDQIKDIEKPVFHNVLMMKNIYSLPNKVVA